MQNYAEWIVVISLNFFPGLRNWWEIKLSPRVGAENAR